MAKQVKKMVKLGEVITCKCCGKQIVKEHTYQDYCSECSYKVMREKNNIAVRKFREKKKMELEAMKQRLAELEQQMEQQLEQQVNDTNTDDTVDTTVEKMN